MTNLAKKAAWLSVAILGLYAALLIYVAGSSQIECHGRHEVSAAEAVEIVKSNHTGLQIARDTMMSPGYSLPPDTPGSIWSTAKIERSLMKGEAGRIIVEFNYTTTKIFSHAICHLPLCGDFRLGQCYEIGG